ncbi:hypothetical protein BGW41_006722 [Actinomortierella wolfii]|nr:hypothetical protein BGW41_006722 [Actinomortierella wolfii]
MKVSLSSGLISTICALAALTSIAEAGLKACQDKCELRLSKSAERCVKAHPNIDSDARFACNLAQGEAFDSCSERCRKTFFKCEKRCTLRLHTDWERCVNEYEDPVDPQRIKCINDVYHQSYTLCVAPCT